jgi:hypothetical protein
MRTASRIRTLGAAVGAATLLSGLPGCDRGPSPTLPGPPAATAGSQARSSLPDPSADVGVWVESTPLTKLWPTQHKGDCIVTDIKPNLGSFTLGGLPTSIKWTIYDYCPNDHVMRIDFAGSVNPFVSCPERPEIARHEPFKIVKGGAKPAVEVTCTLVANPCTTFYIDIDKMQDRTRLDCPFKSGQIEIEPW